MFCFVLLFFFCVFFFFWPFMTLKSMFSGGIKTIFQFNLHHFRFSFAFHRDTFYQIYARPNLIWSCQFSIAIAGCHSLIGCWLLNSYKFVMYLNWYNNKFSDLTQIINMLELKLNHLDIIWSFLSYLMTLTQLYKMISIVTTI